MEAAAVACRGGVLAPAQPGGRARPRPRRHGVVAGPAARRRFIVASVGEPPLSAPSSNAVALALETVQVDGDVASTEILPSPDIPVRTVCVKFVLQKQCAFGQRFLLVGDDPALGGWDPSKATGLDWSEDHVWTVRRDLPAHKSIEFKFLLQEPSGEVLWQHGSNRTLQITQTSNTLVVYEDWEEAEMQKLSEEVDLSIGVEDVILPGYNGALPADEHRSDAVHQGVSKQGETTVSLDGEGSAAINQPQDKHQKIQCEIRSKANMVTQNGNPAGKGDYGGRNRDDTIFYEAGAPAETRPISIFQNDMAWVGKALHRFIRILGFQIGATKT